jgi:ribosomal protein S18 acetylase RimI-like enzyme
MTKEELLSTVELRAVTPNDLDAILDVYRQCEDFLALGPEPTASIRMVLEDIRTSEREGGIFCGVHDPSGKIIGVVDFVPGNIEGVLHNAFISLLMVAMPFRKQGIGAKIVELVEEEIEKGSRATTILSAVQVNNPGALRFWRKNRYQITKGPELRPDKTTVYHLRKDLPMDK